MWYIHSFLWRYLASQRLREERPTNISFVWVRRSEELDLNSFPNLLVTLTPKYVKLSRETLKGSDVNKWLWAASFIRKKILLCRFNLD